jgi:hypothetical protein
MTSLIPEHFHLGERASRRRRRHLQSRVLYRRNDRRAGAVGTAFSPDSAKAETSLALMDAS